MTRPRLVLVAILLTASAVAAISIANAAARDLSAAGTNPHAIEGAAGFSKWIKIFCGKEEKDHKGNSNLDFLPRRLSCSEAKIPKEPGVYEWGWGLATGALPTQVMYVGKADGLDGLQGRCRQYNTFNRDTVGAHKHKRFVQALQRPAASCMWYRFKTVKYSPPRALIEEAKLLQDYRDIDSKDEGDRCMEWNAEQAEDRYERLSEKAFEYDKTWRLLEQNYQFCRTDRDEARLKYQAALTALGKARKLAADCKKACATELAARAKQDTVAAAFRDLQQEYNELQHANQELKQRLQEALNGPRRKIPKKSAQDVKA
jgi:cytochrome c551/c552